MEFNVLTINFLMYLCPLHLGLSLSTAKKSLAPSSLSHINYLYTLIRSPLSILISRLTSPSSLSLALCYRCSSL